MTRMIQRRCDHCKVFYIYQASGHGNYEEQGNSQHCIDCKKAIIAALKKVPVKFSSKWQDIKETETRTDRKSVNSIFGGITTDVLLKWEEKWREDNKGKVVFQQVFPGLFDLSAGAHQSIRVIKGRDSWAQYKFRLSTWEGKKFWHVKYRDKIEVEMEWDNIKDEWSGSIW